MKTNHSKVLTVSLAVLSFVLMNRPARALEPQTLFNFQLSPGTVTGTLIEGPDGNFYGTTAQGGPTGNGTVFRVTPAGVLTTIVSDQANPAAGLVVGNDGLLYGMASAGGGPAGFGSVFKLTTDGVLTRIAVFDGVNGGNPQSGLVLANDGNFYGTSQEGGTNGIGAVFRVTPGGLVTTLVSFDGASLGGFPVAGLAKGPDGHLYGVTTIGGDLGRGTIFKVTTAGLFTTLHSFQGTDGFVHRARLTAGPDGNLYGTVRDGGSADMGEIFKISTNGFFATVASFTGTNGAVPFAELTVGADGQLYGTTQLGGSATAGTIFKVTTNGVLTTLVSFSTSINGAPQAGLLLASDGNFYGCSLGAVFKMTPAGVLTTIASLIPVDGNRPQAGLTLGPDGSFYGTTFGGGSNNFGTIFRLTPNGVLTSLFAFNNTNGPASQAGLALGKDGNFYGTTTQGGSSFLGSIFRFSTNGTLTTLVSFNGTNGADPRCQLIMDTNGNFYGTALHQGPNGVNGFGTVFRVATNGVLTTLASFNNTNGSFPADGLVAGSDGNFYGTTVNGGSHALGTVFRITPGGVLTSLFSFNNTNGANPQGGLVQGSDGNLFGTTFGGGTNLPFGTIFKITTNGALTTLFDFHFTDGESPSTKLIFGSDGNLYGTTAFGGVPGPGATGFGSVFRLTTNGMFTSLLLFQGPNGSSPQAPLTLGPDGNLYGTTEQGGSAGGGTIFRLVLTPRFDSIARVSAGNVLITGTGPSAAAYRLWTSGDLSLPVESWIQLTNGVFAADGTFSFTDTGTAAIPARFYRVSAP